MSKHTPGPWTVDRGGIYSSTGMAVTNWPVFHEPQEADANLIAAAPDLLAALDHLVRAHDAVDSVHLGARVREARIAVAKARGGA